MERTNLYKYRSLENFEFFLDILLNKQLYAASYENMNDAMEGVYYNYGLKKDILKDIKEGKSQLRICSLSKAKNNPLLWAHYANGSRGVCIELDVTAHNINVTPIHYDGIPTIKTYLDGKSTAREILTHKHKSWSYEEEMRVFTTKDYVTIKIKRIILGERISKSHKKLIKGIVDLLPDDITVVEYEDYKKELVHA